MNDTQKTRPSETQPCSIQGCPGAYEQRTVVHTVRHKGEIVVIEDVPAEVCSACGDVLFAPETLRHIQRMVRERTQPVTRRAPVYQYA